MLADDYWIIILMICIFSKQKALRLPEEDAEALHPVEVLKKYYYICYELVDMNNKLYKMHGTYIKILIFIWNIFQCN